MEKCECWHCGTCWGTRECEECTCDGDTTKCNFYPEKRKEKKIMNTAEMWLKAQEDDCCYEAIMSQSTNEELFYQKNKGFFDGDGYGFILDDSGSLEDIMNIKWKLRIMTKSEAEKRFNIKIIGD